MINMINNFPVAAPFLKMINMINKIRFPLALATFQNKSKVSN